MLIHASTQSEPQSSISLGGAPFALEVELYTEVRSATIRGVQWRQDVHELSNEIVCITGSREVELPPVRLMADLLRQLPSCAELERWRFALATWHRETHGVTRDIVIRGVRPHLDSAAGWLCRELFGSEAPTGTWRDLEQLHQPLTGEDLQRLVCDD